MSKETDKKGREGYSQYPGCPECGHAMVWTSAFPGSEYACLPCNVDVPMFNCLPKVWRAKKAMAEKKKRWGMDLSVIGLRIGGGTCAMCKDGKCKYCKNADNKNYKFKYWKKNL